MHRVRWRFRFSDERQQCLNSSLYKHDDRGKERKPAGFLRAAREWGKQPVVNVWCIIFTACLLQHVFSLLSVTHTGVFLRLTFTTQERQKGVKGFPFIQLLSSVSAVRRTQRTQNNRVRFWCRNITLYACCSVQKFVPPCCRRERAPCLFYQQKKIRLSQS